MRQHGFSFRRARCRTESIHKLNLFCYRSPKRCRRIGRNPFTIDLRLERPISVKAPTDFAINPIARKNCGNELAQSAAPSDGL